LKFGWFAFDGGVPQLLAKSEGSGGQNCLREIAARGSILCRFNQSFELLRLRGTASGPRRGAI
jgi:hypothetical protein